MNNILKKYELLWHILFWLFYLIVLTMVFARFLGFEQAILRNIVNAAVLAPLVYFNLYFLVGKYLFKEKYIQYAAAVLFLILATSPLRAYIDTFFSNSQNNPLVMYSAAHYGTIFLSSVIMLGITTTLKLLEEWYDKKEMETELLRHRFEAELKFLKAQINPHFLFNVLNNIYSLTYLEGKAAAPQILKLSGLMRYMLYESDETIVDLKNEIDYIKNYLDLQQLKSESANNIVFNLEGNTDQIKIAPLLFIPFFENAFKHGDVLDNKSGYIKASIKVTTEELNFHMENTIAPAETRKDTVGGIGLDNVQKRLQLLYPSKHSLSISKENNIFIVDLKIQFA